jgi:hypothetical protein
MWIGDPAYQHPERLPLFFQRLREMQINTAMVYGAGDPQPLVDNDFPYYVENMVNRGLCLKFNSTVRDWDKTVTDWAGNGRPDSALIRDYCLDDPAWFQTAREVVGNIVQKNKGNAPLLYDLRDELSTTISANPFDYDFNPIALEQFRAWLKTQYSDLSALNSEWETRFSSWDEVRPFTTDQIKNRMATGDGLPRGNPDWQKVQHLQFEPSATNKNGTSWNFSPWADFRTYMDVSLAGALQKLRQAAHDADPSTPVGIEGTQMPSAFGGYDLWRLSQALDWVEPYDIGCAREIFGSFMPERPILTTVFETQTHLAKRRLWHLLLEGDRGCLVWWSEDCLDWKGQDWQLTSKARALAPVFQEMVSPLAQLFMLAAREHDPFFIHYSQASIQVDWLLESTVDGSTWLRRFSSFEAEHNRMAKTRAAWLKALQDLGYSPQFISSTQLEMGQLKSSSNAVVVLPGSWALSEKECEALQTTLSRAGRILLEGPAGAFDEHGKLRRQMPPNDLLPTASTNSNCLGFGPNRSITSINRESRGYLSDRLAVTKGSLWLDWVREQLQLLQPEVVVDPNVHARIHRFHIKAGRLVAIERNIEYQMSEDLKQAGGNQSLERPLAIKATLRTPAHIYDLRAGTYLGFTDHIQLTLDPWQPSLFALLPQKVPAKSIVEDLLARSDGTK